MEPLERPTQSKQLHACIHGLHGCVVVGGTHRLDRMLHAIEQGSHSPAFIALLRKHRSSWDAKEQGNDRDYLHNLGAAQDYNSENDDMGVAE